MSDIQLNDPQTLYRRWATNGQGLTITGNVMVDRRHIGEPGNVVVEDERHLDDLTEWASIVKSHGAVGLVQINHPGRQTPRSLVAHPVAPSAVKVPGMAGTFAAPRALTEAEIEDIITRFATTARIVTKSGFDGVQIHGAHGYLVSQFLSPLANQRTDGWGGSVDGRIRFAVEVAGAVAEAIGGDKVGIANFPAGPKANSPFIVTSWGMAIAKQSKRKDLAMQFVNWATSKELAVKAMLANITMARSSVWDDKAVLAKINPGLVETRAFAAKNGYPLDRPYMSAVGEARDLIVFFLAQKHVVAGLTAGALKG